MEAGKCYYLEFLIIMEDGKKFELIIHPAPAEGGEAGGARRLPPPSPFGC